jgi:YidC/Oxa1 family membrane protein insertase
VSGLLFASVLGPIEDVLTVILEWLHTTTGLSWAFSIIALTLMVRIVIVPLTVKQIHSMQRLQALAPEMKALQQKYKTDKKRQQEEMMRFYQEHQVNPLASCLPILLQIPIFISLFFVLRDFEKEVYPDYLDTELGFLGIVPSITDDISSHWSGWLLIFLYVTSQVASTFFMSATMDKRQRYLFMALPVFFIPFIISFPMGLMLYWTTTNLWTVGQGVITRRLVPKPAPAPKRSSRTPARGSEAPSRAEAPPKPTADGDGAKAVPAPADRTETPSGQRKVRRRKKRGPQARRR